MAWPKLKHISCNFPREYLPVIKQAMDNGFVVWGRSSGFCEYFTSTFKWADCEWEIDEMSELICSVKLIEGTIDPELLTIAVLQGKIDT